MKKITQRYIIIKFLQTSNKDNKLKREKAVQKKKDKDDRFLIKKSKLEVLKQHH